MEKFRWAYIGNGNIANSTARDILRGEHEIVSVYGRNKEKSKDFAEKYSAKSFNDFDSAVNRADVDGVYIATPHTSHVDYAVRAMKLGKPVLCEKPVGVTVADVDTLVNTAKAKTYTFARLCGLGFQMLRSPLKSGFRAGR